MANYQIDDKLKSVIDTMPYGGSVRIETPHDDIIAKITKGEHRLWGELEAKERFVVEFEYKGQVVCKTIPVEFSRLDAVVSATYDGYTTYLNDKNNGGLGKIIKDIEDAVKATVSYVAPLGYLENKRGIPDSERITVCMGKKHYELKPEYTNEMAGERYKAWKQEEWEKKTPEERYGEEFCKLVARWNAENVYNLAREHEVRIWAWSYRGGYDEETRTTDHNRYWDISVFVPSGRVDEDGKSIEMEFKVRGENVDYAHGRKGIQYLAAELKKIASDPLHSDDIANKPSRVSETPFTGAEKVEAAKKILEFAQKLEDYEKAIPPYKPYKKYIKERNNKRGGEER